MATDADTQSGESPLNETTQVKVGKAEKQSKDAPKVPKKKVFVLMKNAGILENGMTHQFYAAGLQLDPVQDKDLIADLHKVGALIEVQEV